MLSHRLGETPVPLPPDTPPTVLTPAGRVPADQVRHLHPGQTVRRNDDGTYTVIDKTAGSLPSDAKERDPHERSRPDPRRL